MRIARRCTFYYNFKDFLHNINFFVFFDRFFETTCIPFHLFKTKIKKQEKNEKNLTLITYNIVHS
jgi:hypothetical protein